MTYMGTKTIEWATTDKLKEEVDNLIAKGYTDVRITRTSDWMRRVSHILHPDTYTACYLIFYAMTPK